MAIDDDGQAFIDYLGQAYHDNYADVTDAKVIQTAHQQVLLGAAHFKEAKNSKVAFRYTLLSNYFEDRLPIWNDVINREHAGSESAAK